ncbi:unnamed protein product [Effrenium voratum]|nr:unnamed protein product [Effrenium voratum]
MACERSSSRSPRRRESCFEMNSRWWRSPGSLAADNPLSDYDRDVILKQNPLAADLVQLNQQVITCDSQDSHAEEPSVPPDEWYAGTKKRRPGFAKDLRRHQRRRSKTALLQRSYVEMVCASEEQARLIINAVKDTCYFVLTRRDASQECSAIFDELDTDALPLTVMIFPECEGELPLHFVLTNMFRGVGAEDMADLHRRLEECGSYPPDFCSLWLCSRTFGPLPPGFPRLESFPVGDDSITGAMYSAVLCALAKKIRSKEPGPHSEQLSRLRSSGHPAAPRVVHETCKEWERGQKMISGEDYVYSKESGRYCALHAGRANPKAWSLALECRNFKDGLSKEIFYQERVFVMSRPRVFRRYHRILGLSGSIGSEPERKFLQETYRAAFFEVPPFLKTCRGSPFHEPLPAKLGSSQAAVYVEENVEAQTSRIAEVAFEARERVPVLIIAKDRMHADSLLESMQMAARSRGFGTTSQEMWCGLYPGRSTKRSRSSGRRISTVPRCLWERQKGEISLGASPSRTEEVAVGQTIAWTTLTWMGPEVCC